MATNSSWYFGLAACLIALTGCTAPVVIREHRFVVSDLRETAAVQIEAELKAEGVNVRRDGVKEKGAILNDKIADYTFVIVDPNYTEQDLARVTKIITNTDREDPVIIRSTVVQQEYVSASGEGTARVELRVDLTENAKAFYKSTGTQVELRRTEGQQSATFDYLRKSREEHVDIYVVPDYAAPEFKPTTFIRISLSHPYASQRLQWDPWYVRLWKALFGEKKTN